VLGGTTTIDSGRIECPAGIGVQNGAVISGDGLFTGDMVCSGKLDPEITGPNGGLFTIQGDLIMNPTGSIDIELGGTPGSNHYDRINVTGTASFNGTVYVRLAPGFVPQAGQQFIACNATGGRTGTFTNIVPVDLATHPCTGTTFVMVYSSTAAIILVRPPDADTNDDGFVDVNDLLAVITHWGFCGNSPSEPACDGSNADGTGNGTGTVVDVNDLLVVISHWGSCP
jgi:hypothetical protein